MRAGVDAAVSNQLLQRNPGDFPPDGVKAGEGDGLGGVVDDQVDAGQRLEGADVAALPADDPALHLVARQVDDRNGRLADMVGGAAGNGKREDVAGLFLGLVF